MNASHSLSELIQSVEDSKGWTLREIARRIERTGRTMSHAYVARLKREPIRSITYDTIHALSVGLELPEQVVAEAALRAMGVHDIGTAEAGAAVAIARDPDLSERDRKILLAVVREMQSERPDEDHSGESSGPAAPSTAAAGGSIVEDPPQPDGVTTGERRRPLTKDDFSRAADDSGPSLLEADDARAAARGEESQDPGSDEPA